MREESLIEALQDISDIKRTVESIAYADNKIDWEQRRYEIAKSAMQGMAVSSWWLQLFQSVPDTKGVSEQIAHRAVMLADALIAELKKKGE